MSRRGPLTRERPNQLVDFLLGSVYLITACAGIAIFSPILALIVFVFFTGMYLVELATHQRARRRRRTERRG